VCVRIGWGRVGQGAAPRAVTGRGCWAAVCTPAWPGRAWEKNLDRPPSPPATRPGGSRPAGPAKTERNVTSSSRTRNRIRLASLLLATLGVAGCSNSSGIGDAGTRTGAKAAAPASPLLAEVAQQIALPARTWTASGTHTAKGYTTQAATTTSVEGMRADCENINLNKKLAADFRSDVFGHGLKGFFYQCQRVGPDTNRYWFIISSADQAQIHKLCDPSTRYPIVHDEQHETYWIDEPFTCTSQAGPW
jgi:hypothetical protein